MKHDVSRNQFLGLSVVLTGFTRVDLEGTGVADEYRELLAQIVGEPIVSELVATVDGIVERHGTEGQGFERSMRRRVMSDAKLGPVARNVTKMWFSGNWYQLPASWRAQWGSNPMDTDHVISSAAYIEALVWPASGTHPMGAKQPGFATWAEPPRQPTN